MLGLGLRLQARAPAARFFAPGAALAIAFRTGQAMKGGLEVDPASLITVTRANSGWSADKAGVVSAFAANTARRTDAGLDLGELANRLHGAFPEHGTNTGSTTTTLPTDGLFAPREVSSQGSLIDRRSSGSFSITSGTLLAWRARVKTGTSGRCAIHLENTSASTISTISGPVGAMAVSANAAGTVTISGSQTYGDGSVELWGTWTPNAAGTAQLAVGPDSAVSGQSVQVIGAQVSQGETGWIMGSSGTVSQAGDVCLLDLTDLSLASGFMLRLDGELLSTYPTQEYARVYQADGGNNANKLATYIYTPEQDFRVEQHNAWANQGMKPLGGVSPGAFSLTTAHGPNFVGGMLGGVAATPDTNAGYSAPTRLHVSSIENTFHQPMRLHRLAIYAEAPTQVRLAEISA
ncbi:MAG: hypothetical protein AB8B88_10790 [Devosiaceae bacterium]